MLRGVCILVIIFALWYALDTMRGQLPPDLRIQAIREFRHLSPEHYDKAHAAARAFERERLGDADVSMLAYHTATILTSLRELYMRLPNDAAASDRLDALIDHTEYVLQHDMQTGYELSPSTFPIRQFWFYRGGVAPTMLKVEPVRV